MESEYYNPGSGSEDSEDLEFIIGLVDYTVNLMSIESDHMHDIYKAAVYEMRDEGIIVPDEFSGRLLGIAKEYLSNCEIQVETREIDTDLVSELADHLSIKLNSLIYAHLKLEIGNSHLRTYMSENPDFSIENNVRTKCAERIGEVYLYNLQRCDAPLQDEETQFKQSIVDRDYTLCLSLLESNIIGNDIIYKTYFNDIRREIDICTGPGISGLL